MDDEQQLEALKKWWSENGKTVITGVVIGLGAIGGWNWWQASSRASQEAASAQLSTAMTQVLSTEAAETSQGVGSAQELAANSDGIHATLGSLLAARGALSGGDTDTAEAQLRQAIDNADNEAARALARLRLARVLLEKGDFGGAAASLDAIESTAFDGLREELHGDIASARDDAAAARQRYAAALEVERLPLDSQARLQLKLDALGSYTTPPDK